MRRAGTGDRNPLDRGSRNRRWMGRSLMRWVQILESWVLVR